MVYFAMHLLAQTTAPAAPAAPPPVVVPAQPPIISLDMIFWFSVLAILLITIITALIRRLSKDKALKLFHEYHVAFFSERRPAIWGDCLVSSQGIELLFDEAFVTRRKLIKSSALLYDDELTPMICLTRSVHRLNEEELRDRARQIQKTFHPGVVRRARRWMSNMLNTMRDAITKTMNLVIGRMTAVPGSMAGAAISTQAGDINALTGSVVSLAANAYEPLLERYIGQPVVLEITMPVVPGAPPLPPGALPPVSEFPGYLVDYTQKFIAVFNVEHTPVETLEIRLEPGKPPAPDLADLKIVMTEMDTVIRCEGRDAFVLRELSAEGQVSDMGIAMIPGTSVVLAALEKPAVLKVERTRQIDLVVPRTRGQVRYGSLPARKGGKRNWLGISPVLESRVQALRSFLAERGDKA